MNHSLSLQLKALSAAALLMAASAAYAYANSVIYAKGQGLIADGFGGYDLVTERCGIANGADADGPYILWVLTASGAKKADITGPWGTAQMTKFGNGTFKYVSGWYAPASLPGNITATYDGKAKNAQLVVSHGCRPYVAGAWCSPGFWKNAEAAAWTLAGSRQADYFNATVVPDFYATASGANPTLGLVLTTPGANTFGSDALPYGLNAYNATGAYLSNRIPNYQFSLATLQAGGSDACPIDHHGNYKVPQ